MCIRQEIEQLEELTLASYAMRSRNSRGRVIDEEPDPLRTCYMRDRDRIIHSKSFRRLKHKTQVYISPENDHYRTRLTHTLEVNQISKTVGAALRLNLDLIEAIAMGHDVGHTPFSHTGEEVLNMLLPGGFRHNENSVRVLTRIEQGKRGCGLNLSREVLDGVLHHSGFATQEQAPATLEGQVVRYADKIAYVQHDIDDSIRAGVLTKEDLPREYLEILGHSHGERIATLVLDLIEHSRENFKKGELKITLGPRVDRALKGLRKFMFEHVYKGPLCRLEREKAMYVVEFVFNYYRKNPEKMPEFYVQIAREEGVDRGVADYISGMTDNYCVAIFKDLVLPRSLLKAKF
ncbi:MAG: deoxyguanosinetriphosphate triphosphohydrolase [Peptococcaceae bacterium]|jgi:dGTPase|nr:deoxyguanosinetriphosphate triphosphohydrolase [Peptococcaceae bacterium]